MGWEEGKGLGSTSQGITAPIMVRAKDNNKVQFYLNLVDFGQSKNIFLRALDIKVEMMFGSIIKMTLMTYLQA